MWATVETKHIPHAVSLLGELFKAVLSVVLEIYIFVFNYSGDLV